MLKIAEYRNVLGEDGKSIRRERIALKELEKFGFFKDYIVDQNVYRKTSKIKKAQIEQICELIIWDDREIAIYSISGFLDNTLYDLIQARISRKVEE